MANGNFVPNLSNYIGQTVTVFTTSGGDSGRGFTGVLAMVNPSFIRLITQIGPAPGCALGNCCERQWPSNVGGVQDDVCTDGLGNYPTNVEGQRNNLGGQERINCNANRGLGSVVDIPVDRIASFVHNAVGGGW
jgi:hypothetical protein